MISLFEIARCWWRRWLKKMRYEFEGRDSIPDGVIEIFH